MRLILRVAGRELLHVELDTSEPTATEAPRLEASGGGQFELAGFGFELADSGGHDATTVPRR